MASIRFAQVMAVLMTIVGTLLVLEVILWITELFLNWFFFTLLKFPGQLLDLPSPLTIISQALSLFPNLWRMGTILWWGFVAELTFIALVISGILYALTSVPALLALKTFFQAITDYADAKSVVGSSGGTDDETTVLSPGSGLRGR